jgi:hypothetical protein
MKIKILLVLFLALCTAGTMLAEEANDQSDNYLKSDNDESSEQTQESDEVNTRYGKVKKSTNLVLHGLRLGYIYIFNTTQEGLSERNLHMPHLFLFGYEAAERIIAHEKLYVIFVQNILFGGFEQDTFFASINIMAGLEIFEWVQVLMGYNIAPVKDAWGHFIFAIGITPKLERGYIPLHITFIPDKNNNHRLGVTLGVNW